MDDSTLPLFIPIDRFNDPRLQTRSDDRSIVARPRSLFLAEIITPPPRDDPVGPTDPEVSISEQLRGYA